MKTKVELGKYYNHNPNHFRFPRTCDMGSSYVSIDSDKEQSWAGVIFGLILIMQELLHLVQGLQTTLK